MFEQIEKIRNEESLIYMDDTAAAGQMKLNDMKQHRRMLKRNAGLIAKPGRASDSELESIGIKVIRADE